MTTDRPGDQAGAAGGGIRWVPFLLVCATYASVTVGEQLLSPVFPTVRTDLGISKGQGGVAFGALAIGIAVFNMVSGLALRRFSAATVVRVSLVVTAIGAVVAALANGIVSLVISQILVGAGAGLFFPAGLQGVAVFGGVARRGFAMGLYGVAFSAGLTVAALFGSLGASAGWRVPFWITVGLAAATLVSLISLRTPVPDRRVPRSIPWSAVLGLPTLVGTVGATLQYGVLAFFTTFAVDEWDMPEARAAVVLAVGRVISILAKLVGGRATDRIGPRASVLRTGVVLSVLGVAWVVAPANIVTYAMAAVFAGTVSSIFPAANVMAVERFGGNGLALGAYRSVQIAIGAVAGVVIGNSPLGLRYTVLIAVLSSLLLVWWCRPQRSASPAVDTSVPT